MKNICKIKIHPLSYLVALIFFITGQFKNYFTFMIIILIHELGHILSAIYLKWQIEKIIILPFGGLTKFREKINKPIYQEFVISIMGIIFQIILCFNMNKYYNILIIIFNLLPIHPLDGSKILNLLLNKISNFKFSYYLTLYISYFALIIIFIIILIHKDLICLIIFLPLLFQLNNEYKNRYNLINKFYLERYLYYFYFKRRKTINNINKMKRDYLHIFHINEKYITEKDFLRKWFDK